jgi:hypothetical protein
MLHGSVLAAVLDAAMVQCLRGKVLLSTQRE